MTPPAEHLPVTGKTTSKLSNRFFMPQTVSNPFNGVVFDLYKDLLIIPSEKIIKSLKALEH